MKFRAKRTSIALVALIVLAFGWQLSDSLNSEAEKGGVVLTQVTLGSIESVVTSQGTLEPMDYVDVGAQVSGKILKLHVDIGDQVKDGDLIAEIDPDVYEASVLANQARLKNLQAQAAEKAASLKQAQRKFERNTRLYKSKAVSLEALQDSESTLEIAKANLKAIEAQVEEAQSTLDAAKTNLEFTKIYSSMDGTVVSREVQEGQTINASQTAPTIVQVANLDKMTVVAEVAEADVMKLKQGMTAYFNTLGSGERRWSGSVRQIEPTPVVENDVVLYNVMVDVDNSDRSLMKGMTTQMFFVLASAKNVPIVPLSVLKDRVQTEDTEIARAYSVMIEAEKGGRQQMVFVGVSDRTHAEIIEGVEVGDRIITAQNSRKKSSSEAAGSQGRGPRGPRGMGRI